MFKKRNKKSFGIILVTICVFVIIFSILFSGIGNIWQTKLSDFLYKERDLRDDITIITLDNETLSEKNLGSYEKWRRSYFAKVLNNISKYQPKVVGVDFYFKDLKDKGDDSQLKDSFEKNKTVIVFPSNAVWDNSKQMFIQQNEYDSRYSLPHSYFSTALMGVSMVVYDESKIARYIVPQIYRATEQLYLENFAFDIVREYFDGGILNNKSVVTKDKYTYTLDSKRSFDVPLDEGRFIINYASNSSNEDRQYNNVSFMTVYNESYGDHKVDPNKLFKNKIVLIGPTADFFKDVQLTPISKSTMPGVEIHANAIQTILDGKFLRNMTTVEKVVLIVFVVFGLSFFFMFTRIRWSIVGFFGFIALYTLAAPFAFDHGLIVDLVHPYLAAVCSFVAVYLYRYLTEFREKMALKSAFGKYVNVEIAKQISEHPELLCLGGEKRVISVLFTDIAHFTSISESLRPESLVALLNEYFEVMSRVIMDEGGTVDKYEGDAIMAFFGAPLKQKDHAARACRAALKMRLALADLLAKWKNDPCLPGGEAKPMIDFRCGVASGEAIVGNIGSQTHFNYTVMGDTVNLGSRLEGANKKYETHTMVNEETFLLVKDEFVMRELDVIRVVGKKLPVRVFELLGMKPVVVESSVVSLGGLSGLAASGEVVDGAGDAARSAVVSDGVVGSVGAVALASAGASVAGDGAGVGASSGVDQNSGPASGFELLDAYRDALACYKERKFAEALRLFERILKTFPDDGPSKLYRQRCEILRDFPPKADWDGVFDMQSK